MTTSSSTISMLKAAGVRLTDPEKIFTIVNRIGSEAHEIKYKAAYTASPHLFAAIRILPIDLDQSMSQESLNILEEEITCIRECSHPNIVSCLEILYYEKCFWIATEYCNAGSINDSILRDICFHEYDIAVIVRGLLEGMLYLQTIKKKLTEVNCCNIFLTGKGRVKISIFGSNTLVYNSDSCSKGLPTNIANQERADIKSDVWSTGVIAWELAQQQLSRLGILYSEAVDPSVLVNDQVFISSPLVEFMRFCLVQDAKNRPLLEECLCHPFVQDPRNDELVSSELMRRIEERAVSDANSSKMMNAQSNRRLPLHYLIDMFGRDDASVYSCAYDDSLFEDGSCSEDSDNFYSYEDVLNAQALSLSPEATESPSIFSEIHFDEFSQSSESERYSVEESPKLTMSPTFRVSAASFENEHTIAHLDTIVNKYEGKRLSRLWSEPLTDIRISIETAGAKLRRNLSLRRSKKYILSEEVQESDGILKLSTLVIPQALYIEEPYKVSHDVSVTFSTERAQYEGAPGTEHWQSIHKQFGIELCTMQCQKRGYYDNCIPALLNMLRRELVRLNGVQCPYIYRTSPDNVELHKAKLAIQQGLFDSQHVLDPHIYAGLIKEWFRELPNLLLHKVPLSLFERILNELGLCSATQAVEATNIPNHFLQRCMDQFTELISYQEKCVLLWLADHILEIVGGKSVNQMSAKAMCTVMAPNLYPCCSSTIIEATRVTSLVTRLLQAFLIWRERTCEIDAKDIRSRKSDTSWDLEANIDVDKLDSGTVGEYEYREENDDICCDQQGQCSLTDSVYENSKEAHDTFEVVPHAKIDVPLCYPNSAGLGSLGLTLRQDLNHDPSQDTGIPSHVSSNQTAFDNLKKSQRSTLYVNPSDLTPPKSFQVEGRCMVPCMNG